MQALQGALPGRSTHKASQPRASRGHQVESSQVEPAPKPPSPPLAAPKPFSTGRKLIGWAMSIFGLRSPHAVKTRAVAVEPATAAQLPPAANTPGRLRLAIVGDMHGAWRGEREEAALRLLAPHLTLLVGDFGNEDVALVRQVAALPLPKAVILGNHDAWYTMTGRSGLARRGGVQQTMSAADLLSLHAVHTGGGAGADGGSDGASADSASAAVQSQDGVRQQLAALGPCHVGYSSMQMDEQGYTVMGARPFSKGGRNFSSIRAFMEGLYGVTSMEESTARIVQVAESVPPQHALILMGHNGPTGLGDRAFDICGVDWEDKAGDHGDPDLQAALAALHRSGRRVPLVAFGHMHHTLHARHSRGLASPLRRMVALDPATGTVFLNAATVPRVTPAPKTTGAAAAAAAAPPTSPKSFGSGRRARKAAKAAAVAAAAGAGNAAATAAAKLPGGGCPATVHHFMVAELERGAVVSARDMWVQVTPVTIDTAVTVPEVAAARPGSYGGEAAEDGSDSGDGGGEGAAAAHGPRRIGEFVVQVVREQVVLRTVAGANGGVVKFIWNAHDQVYEPYILGDGASAGPRGGNGNYRPAAATGAAIGPSDGSEDRRIADITAAKSRSERNAKPVVTSGLKR